MCVNEKERKVDQPKCLSSMLTRKRRERERGRGKVMSTSIVSIESVLVVARVLGFSGTRAVQKHGMTRMGRRGGKR